MTLGMALAGTWFGFANPFLHLPLAILLLPAALVLAANRAETPGQAFRMGMLTALPGYAASLYWLVIPVHDHGSLPWALALPCPVLVGGVLAAYGGIYCLGIYLLGDKGRHPLALVFSGLLWATLELARNHLLTGFPWLTLASAFSPWSQTLGLAAWCGAFGLSGLLAGMGHALVLRGWRRLLVLPMIGLCVLPAWITSSAPAPATASVAMVQGNIEQGQKWDETLQTTILQTYVELSRQAVSSFKSDLLVWPETALPFYLQDPGDLSSAMRIAVAELGTPVLAGSPAYSMPLGKNEPRYVLHNRAYLLGPNGEIQAWYDKEHLVPFGEYVPLGQWLPFLTKLVPGEYEFRPGQNSAPLRSGDMAVGTLICYEAIFPELAQKQVELGANVLVNISNDAWFGRTSAPLQHLHLTILRAVEQNRAIIRCTNTGVSTFIDPDGRLRDRSELFTTDILHRTDIPLLTQKTFYHEHFLFIHWCYPFLTLGLLVVLRRRGPNTSA